MCWAASLLAKRSPPTWTVTLAYDVVATNPSMDACGVQTVFVTERGGEIPFFRCYERGVAGDAGGEEQHEDPREIECQSHPDQHTHAAEVQRIP